MTAPASGEPLADHPCPPDTGTASGHSDPVGPLPAENYIRAGGTCRTWAQSPHLTNTPAPVTGAEDLPSGCRV
ncbi:hypothetical protein GCM10009546_32470 [Actinomadura livida]|uniref:Uncharacterized protein n=1 Tax=Actinomadura livida TaxID=79909 RepID=A0ABP3PHV1_9ACTN|nr:hypothetical protein GCM10010208_41470 [Actinomadura livida]